MNVTEQLECLKVKEVFNESTKRPFLFVYPETRLFEVITFLAIGPEIYVDGVIVVAEENHNGKKIQVPLGKIGGKNILCSMLESANNRQDEFLGHVTASKVMTEITRSDCAGLESSLSEVIDIFERTRFAIVPIIDTSNESNYVKPIVIGTLTVRDFLPLIVNKKISIGHAEIKGIINQISSPLVSVSRDTTIKDAVSIMVNKGIRNIGIKNCYGDHLNQPIEGGNARAQGSGLCCIVNDRKIMEFLLSNKRRENSTPIFGSVNDIDMLQMNTTKSSITLREAAQYLMDIRNQFLILDGNKYIVTPWDLVMKTARTVIS